MKYEDGVIFLVAIYAAYDDNTYNITLSVLKCLSIHYVNENGQKRKS